MEDISRTIDALTSMIAINKKRAAAYQSLAEKTHRHEAKLLLLQFADQSRRFASGLSTWRAAYGGFGVADRKSGVSTWSQVRSLFGLNSGKHVITECEEMEQDAIKIYRAAVGMTFIPSATVVDIQKQLADLEKSLSKLRAAREQFVVRENLAVAS